MSKIFEQASKILKKYYGYNQFRPLQFEIIDSVLNGHDTLGILPTGGGKSITYQVPALLKDGICIVVTPLIALMKDQIDRLQKRGIFAISVHAGMTREEIDIALDNCIYGNFKFLYCSPERLGTEIFRARVKKMQVNLIAVDEAHCISMWGYDFRPSYLKIAELRDLLPKIPVLALTATATSEVAKDIMEKLRFEKANIIQQSFERKNLIYVVRTTENKNEQLLKVFHSVKGPGIVYVRNRVKSHEISNFLSKNGFKADYYHAGLPIEQRSIKQDRWTKGKVLIMVATNAFGMGIDKADVRTVVHYDLPDSIENYYQEAGRAGRDGKKSYAVLLFNNFDKYNIEQRITINFPEIKTIKTVYNALGNYFQIPIGAGKYVAYDFNLYDFANQYKLNVAIAYSCLKILEQEGYIEMSDEINNPSKIHFLVNRDDLYKFQVANLAFDAFIKLLLRSYEGLFTKYVNIDEETLAKRANTSVDNIYKYINKLSTAGIIQYIPRKNNPVIVFTEERLEDKALHISVDIYKKRKELYISKIENMLHYAEASNKCRSQIILFYFGETSAVRCGQCDNCLKRNELELSKYEFDLIVEQIKKKVQNTPTTLENIINTIDNRYSKEKIIKVIRWLIDNAKMYQDNEKLLHWKSNS